MVRICLKKIITTLLLLLILNINVAFSWERQGDSAWSMTGLDVFEDVGGTYDFMTVSSPNFDGFQYNTQNQIYFGISKSVYWVRFILPFTTNRQNDEKQLLELGNPNFNKIDVYLPVSNSDSKEINYVIKNIGVTRPTANRDILDNFWIIPISRQYIDGQFVYLRLESVSILRLPVSVWKESAFFTYAFKKNIGYGIFYGVLIAMLLYNLFIFVALRDKTYLFYVLYLFFMFLYQFQVYGHFKLWLDLAYPIYNALFWICLSCAFVFSVFFTRHFLQIYNEEAIWSKVIALFLAMALIAGVSGSFGFAVFANRIDNFLGIIEPMAFIALAIFRWRQGFYPAIFYLLAWGMLSVGILSWILVSDRLLAAEILMVATGAEAVLLSLALSDKFSRMRLKQASLARNVHYYRDLSQTDELTGLYNRRCLQNKIQEETNEALQHGESLALIILDVDFFKLYNDSYGHWQGDQVLIRLSRLMLEILSDSQMAFRFGGEEFVILLPNSQYREAVAIAEKIRNEFAKEEFVPLPEKSVHVTLSAGLTVLKSGDTVESLFERADKALYRAKESGRNKVVGL